MALKSGTRKSGYSGDVSPGSVYAGGSGGEGGGDSGSVKSGDTTVRDPSGRRVPKPVGDPSGEGYAKQYEAYEAAGGDVSKSAEPTYYKEQAAKREKLVSTPEYGSPEYIRASERGMSKRGLTEYKATETVRLGIREKPDPEKPGYVLISPVTPPRYEYGVPTPKKIGEEPKITPKKTFWQKAISKETQAGIHKKIKGWEEKILTPVVSFLYPWEKEKAKLEKERELRIISESKRFEIETGRLTQITKPKTFEKEMARLKKKGYAFEKKGEEYIITKPSLTTLAEKEITVSKPGVPSKIIRGLGMGAAGLAITVPFLVAKGVTAPFSTVKEIGKGVKEIPSYFKKQPVLAGAELAGTIGITWGLGRIAGKLTKPKVVSTKLDTGMKELMRETKPKGGALRSIYSLEAASRTVTKGRFKAPKVVKLGLKGEAGRFYIKESIMGTPKKGGVPITLRTTGGVLDIVVPEEKAIQLADVLWGGGEKPTLGISRYAIEPTPGKITGAGIGLDITKLFKVKGGKVVGIKYSEPLGRYATIKGIGEGTYAESFSLGRVFFEKEAAFRIQRMQPFQVLEELQKKGLSYREVEYPMLGKEIIGKTWISKDWMKPWKKKVPSPTGFDIEIVKGLHPKTAEITRAHEIIHRKFPWMPEWGVRKLEKYYPFTKFEKVSKPKWKFIIGEDIAKQVGEVTLKEDVLTGIKYSEPLGRYAFPKGLKKGTYTYWDVFGYEKQLMKKGVSYPKTGKGVVKTLISEKEKAEGFGNFVGKMKTKQPPAFQTGIEKVSTAPPAGLKEAARLATELEISKMIPKTRAGAAPLFEAGIIKPEIGEKVKIKPFVVTKPKIITKVKPTTKFIQKMIDKPKVKTVFKTVSKTTTKGIPKTIPMLKTSPSLKIIGKPVMEMKVTAKLRTGMKVKTGVGVPVGIPPPTFFFPGADFDVPFMPKAKRVKPVKTARPLGYAPQPAAVILGITAEEVPAPEFGKYGYSPLQPRPVIVPKKEKKKKKKKKEVRRNAFYTKKIW